ncbi:vanadium-dependent haloperoxidase [Massilia glaciei]|uniref:Phosphatase PAP2 family protein n=1 Tax=Massilia glaciei TaxID=1524097 RepID=A0A2U2HLF8_9BURK|nr:vanadium-dependent haloperoxidase [Massilia glaciei]PWF48337.1 phosphatase PAP2 family protein [Massilia glaciei]
MLFWNDTALQAIRAARPGPPMCARSLAIMNTAMYNAWSAYDPQAMSTQHGAATRRPSAEHNRRNRFAAISHAAHAVLLDQFPSQKTLFDAQLLALGLDTTPVDASPGSARSVGAVAAAACIRDGHGDGANQLSLLTASGRAYADYTGYQPRNPGAIALQATARERIPFPGNWQPLTYLDSGGAATTPEFLAACLPRVKPFALTSAAQFRPGPPAAFGSAEFNDQARQLLTIQASMGETEKAIADYWADGPSSELPPGHWILLARFVSERDVHDDDIDVKMYFALANALADAAIAAWDAKICYDSARPISAIRYLMNAETVISYSPLGPAAGLGPVSGAAWLPYQPLTFITPPFAEHVSGHSCFSAAAAEVLKLYTGSDRFGAVATIRARSLKIDPKLPSMEIALRWPTFSDAAAEAGQSRLYGGIHFEKGNTAGLSLGRQVGAAAFAKAERYWSGS